MNDKTPSDIELLAELYRVDTVERASWLEALARQRPAAAQQINRLLAQNARMQAEGFLSGTATDLPQSSPLIGTRVGAYLIEAEAGRGGMASVWRARRADGRFEGLAAIKFIHASALGSEGELRFRREGRFLGQLNHPNIARLLDAGVQDTTGQPYLVLEYVDGVPIDDYAERKRLDTRARIALFLQAARAVVHAHAHLIIHRDLKPSNIFVARDGSVKLLDFGIARLADEGMLGEAAATQSSARALTPQYAAPEQVEGSAITTRTDVYGLGLVLYRLLTGRHAVSFAGPGPQAALHAVLEQDPPAPSTIGELATVPRAELEGDLDNIVLKALRKRPDDRYASAVELADDLQRFLRHEPIAARPDTVTYRVGKFVRRHRGGVAAASAMALAMMAAVVITTQQMIDARRQRDVARHEKERAEAQIDFMSQVLTQLGDDGKPITRELILDRSVEYVDKHVSSRPEFAVGFLIHLSGRYMNLGNTAKELATLQKAELLARRSGEPLLLARVQCNTVETEMAAGQLDRAEARLAEGKAALARLSDPSTGSDVTCLYAEAKLLSARGRRPQAIEVAARAAQLLEERGQETELTYGSVVSLLVVMNELEQRVAEALAWNRRDIEILERSGRANTEDMAFALANKSQLMATAGRPREALEIQREVVRRMTSGTEGNHIHPAMARTMGDLLERLEQGDEGLPWLDRAIDRALATDNRLILGGALVARARARIRRGDLPSASIDLARAAPLDTGDPLADFGMRARLALAHSEMLQASGDTAAALQLTRASLAERGYPGKLPTTSWGVVLRNLAAWQLEVGEYDSARRSARDALAHARKVVTADAASADVGEACLLLARTFPVSDRTSPRTAALRCAILNLTPTLGESHSLTRAAQTLAGDGNGPAG